MFNDTTGFSQIKMIGSTAAPVHPAFYSLRRVFIIPTPPRSGAGR